MPGIITVLDTFNTTGFGRGMAFKGADIYIALPGVPALEQMVKATGVIVADHSPGPFQAFQALYDAANDQFWTTPAGSGFNFNVSRYDNTATLIDNPGVGRNANGQVIANGHYWCANQDDGTLSQLDAATGAPIATVAGVTAASSGQLVYDGTSIWCTAIPNTLYQVDEATATLVNTFTPAGVTRFGGLCFALGFLWATDRTFGNLYKLDLLGNVVATSAAAAAGNGPLIYDGVNFWSVLFGIGFRVTSPAGIFQAAIGATDPSVQWIANDGTPNEAWGTSGNAAPGFLQHFLFTPAAVARPETVGTFTGTLAAGSIGGGTK